MTGPRFLHRVGFLAVAAVLVLPAPAVAGSQTLSPSAEGNNCVNKLAPIVEGSPEVRIASSSCFDTFAAAISFATGGATRLSVHAQPSSLRQKLLPKISGATLAATDVVIGVDWELPSKGGASVVWETPTGCDFSHWYLLGNVGSNWNDRIQSAKGFSGCVRYRHFEHEEYQGLVRTCTPYCQAMPSWTTSLQWDN